MALTRSLQAAVKEPNKVVEKQSVGSDDKNFTRRERPAHRCASKYCAKLSPTGLRPSALAQSAEAARALPK